MIGNKRVLVQIFFLFIAFVKCGSWITKRCVDEKQAGSLSLVVTLLRWWCSSSVCGFDALNFRLEVQLSFFAISTSRRFTKRDMFDIISDRVHYCCGVQGFSRVSNCDSTSRSHPCTCSKRTCRESCWWRCGRCWGLGRVARRAWRIQVWSLGRDDVLCVWSLLEMLSVECPGHPT